MVGIFIVFLLNNLLWILFALLLIATLKNQPLTRMIAPKKVSEETDLGIEKYDDVTDDQLLKQLDNLGEQYKQNRQNRPRRKSEEPVE